MDPTALVVAYLGRLAARIGEPGARVREAYRRRCSTIGGPVELTLPDGRTLAATAMAVDDEGRLLVDGPDGRVAWAAGDLVHTRPG